MTGLGPAIAVWVVVACAVFLVTGGRPAGLPIVAVLATLAAVARHAISRRIERAVARGRRR